MFLEIFLFLFLSAILFRIFRKRAFAIFCSNMCESLNTMLGEYKTEAFEKLNKDAARVGKHKLKILEIGGGSGANFNFIKTPVEWTIVEPNLSFRPYLAENIHQFGGDHKIHELVEARGEDLGMFAPESFDAVIITLVLCSVDDIGATLREVRRVLKPDGQFYFVEHVADQDGTTRRTLQNVLSKTIWPMIFDGCELNREIGKLIKAAGFSSCSISSYETKGLTSYPLATGIYGYASK